LQAETVEKEAEVQTLLKMVEVTTPLFLIEEYAFFLSLI
jgi:hypothetical protein